MEAQTLSETTKTIQEMSIDELRQELTLANRSGDSERSHELLRRMHELRVIPDHVWESLRRTYEKCLALAKAEDDSGQIEQASTPAARNAYFEDLLKTAPRRVEALSWLEQKDGV